MNIDEKIAYLAQYEGFDSIEYQPNYKIRPSKLHFDEENHSKDVYNEIYPRLKAMVLLKDPVHAQGVIPGMNSTIYGFGHHSVAKGSSHRFACLMGHTNHSHFYFKERWSIMPCMVKDEVLFNLSKQDKKRWLIERF